MRNRIKALREVKGWSQTDLGNNVVPPVHWQTIQRIEGGKTPLTTEWMERIATALDVEDPVELLVKPKAIRHVEIVGEVQAGDWSETWEYPEGDRETVPIPDEDAYRNVRLFAARTKGPSMNKRYPDGGIVIVVDYADRPEELKVGRRYIVERERADGMREATVKMLWRDDSGKLWLLPESTDPRHQTPIPIQGEDGDTIRIRGRVAYAVTRED